jgi:hypothetical protein
MTDSNNFKMAYPGGTLSDDSYGRLLSRGGRNLAMAVVFISKEVKSGSQRWHALSPGMRRSADKIINEVKNCNKAVLQTALMAAMGEAPATRAPLWIEKGDHNEQWLKMVGDNIKPIWPPRADGRVITGVAGGLAALAISFCRSHDAALAVSLLLPEPYGRQMFKMSYLANVLAASEIPSEMRKSLRVLLTKE